MGRLVGDDISHLHVLGLQHPHRVYREPNNSTQLRRLVHQPPKWPANLRARVYDPGRGQFLTRDPAIVRTREVYGYASENPINSSDPTGLCGFSSWGDLGDCFNPISNGNIAHQGASLVYHGVTNFSPPSARQLAESYVGFFDGGTVGFTKYLRNLVGIGNGGLELCGPLYEGSEIAGAAVSSFLLPEVPAAVLRLASEHPRATGWIIEHQDELMQMKDTGEEYIRMIFGGK